MNSVDVAGMTETFRFPVTKISVSGFSTYQHYRATGREGGAARLIRWYMCNTQCKIFVTGAYADNKHAKFIESVG